LNRKRPIASLPNQMSDRDRQKSLPFPSGRGGRRRGAGRKCAPGRRPGVPHRRRPDHVSRHPAHVTLRASVRCLRSSRVFPEARRAIDAASGPEFRVVHFSVQNEHVHLIVEAADRDALSRGVWGLAIRLTRAVNRVLQRRGSIWGDRYHLRALRTPREVRNALVYVLRNSYKHGHRGAGRIDPCSSARSFDGFRGWKNPAREVPSLVAPHTWLLRVGWRRHGLIELDERPAPSARKPG